MELETVALILLVLNFLISRRRKRMRMRLFRHAKKKKTTKVRGAIASVVRPMCMCVCYFVHANLQWTRCARDINLVPQTMARQGVQHLL